MKKLVLLLVVTAFVGSPAAADTKEKKAKQTAEADEIAKQHDNTLRACKARASIGAAELVASILFRHASG